MRVGDLGELLLYLQVGRWRVSDDEDDEEVEDEEEEEETEWMCGDCNGSGEGMWGGSVCQFCHGLGVIYGENTESD